ncbi:AraC family transcriptional regulator [Streptosporangium sp. NPDC000396]|uniref:AraC family transcriptional regulator n=1 Tax=Streptosporangium sp. NPDC000396 TaxID=3366185 RepID=UPI0036C6D5CC
MDVLTDVLAAAKIGGVLTSHLRADAPWGFRLDQVPFAAFHAVTRGECWLRRPDAEPLRLVAGDIVLLPMGGGHALASDPSGPLVSYDDILKASGASMPGAYVELAGAGPRTRLICGAYPYEDSVAHPVLAVLPPVLHLPADRSREHGALSATLEMLAAELDGGRPGARTVVDRLVDVLFVHIVREWLDSHAEQRASWLAALRDPPIATAISHLHGDPGRAWTVDELALTAGLSRAAFARRFTALVGEAPLAYLTRWRMGLAAQRLRTTGEPVAVIARSVGYASEFAFSRAFSRCHGMPPGRYRSTHRPATPE